MGRERIILYKQKTRDMLPFSGLVAPGERETNLRGTRSDFFFLGLYRAVEIVGGAIGMDLVDRRERERERRDREE